MYDCRLLHGAHVHVCLSSAPAPQPQQPLAQPTPSSALPTAVSWYLPLLSHAAQIHAPPARTSCSSARQPRLAHSSASLHHSAAICAATVCAPATSAAGAPAWHPPVQRLLVNGCDLTAARLFSRGSDEPLLRPGRWPAEICCLADRKSLQTFVPAESAQLGTRSRRSPACRWHS